MKFIAHLNLFSFPDDEIRNQLCFGETLCISCCHGEGDDDFKSESEFTCEDDPSEHDDDSVSLQAQDVAVQKDAEDSERVRSEIDTGLPEEDFHFYFFEQEWWPKNVDQSVINIDGYPNINPRRRTGACVCNHPHSGYDPRCVCDKGGPCWCYPDGEFRIKCTCKDEDRPCSCLQEPQICPVCACKFPESCLCRRSFTELVCECKEKQPCFCQPDGITRHVCTCDNPNACTCDKEVRHVCTCGNPESCICYADKEVRRVCTCGNPQCCLCNDEVVMPICLCGDPEACICGEDGKIQDKCVCATPVRSQTSFDLVCVCNKAPSMQSTECECFEEETREFCVCGYPNACLCTPGRVRATCVCGKDPCTCHHGKILDECICRDEPPAEPFCPCEYPNPETGELPTKEGFFLCHAVDSHHTYFDYCYGRRDKIVEPKPEKVKKERKEVGKEEPLDTSPRPIIKPKRKHRKISLDCCSATGGMSVNIQTMGEDKDRFLVQVVSHFSKEGARTGTKLISIVDSNLHTLEENRKEHISKGNITKERRQYMAISSEGYFDKVTTICGEKKVINRTYHSFKDSHDFILEGANLLLLRYIAIKRVRGEIRSSACQLNGTICESNYVCHGDSQAIVNGKPMFVVKVDRIIVEKCGISYEIRTVLSRKGYIIQHEWIDSNYIVHINPLLNVHPDTDDIENHEPLRANWRKDIQLMSDYLDFKSKRTSDLQRYTAENEDLNVSMREYLQTLLMIKPTDAIHFTSHFFESVLSDINLPHDDYFECCDRSVKYHFFED